MEWLRAVDLAEYAPNMRGSGKNSKQYVLKPLIMTMVFKEILVLR
jgi:hypothetical protein